MILRGVYLIKRIKNLITYRNNAVLKLLVTKIFTYPIIGLSTLVAFRLVRVRFSLEEFNSFVLIWSSVGIIGIAEYGLGMNLTNHLLIQGFDGDFKKKLKNFSLFLFSPLIFVFITGCIFYITPKSESLFGVSELVGIQLSHLLMGVSVSVLFITCYNLATRISNGVSRFASPHLTLAAGNFLALIMLLYLPKQSTSLIQYLMILSSAYLFSALFQLFNRNLWVKLRVEHLQNSYETSNKKLSGGGYSTIFFLISLIVTFINFFPRWKFSLIESKVEVSGYLTIALVVGVFSSISSALGPVLWNAGVSRKLDSRNHFPLKSYQLISIANLLLLFPFLMMLAALFSFYRIEMNSWHYYTSGVVAYLLFSFQNLHMIASNYLVEGSEILLQLYLLVLQAVLLVFLVIYFDVKTSLVMFMIQTFIALFISFVPSVLILQRKQ